MKSKCAWMLLLLSFAVRPSQDERTQASRIFDEYERTGRTDALTFRSARDFVAFLNKSGLTWTQQAGSLDQERRQNVLSTLALEVASTPTVSRKDAWTVIEWACALVRRRPQTDFARQWLIASNAILPRTDLEVDGVQSAEAETHLSHSLAAYPNAPELRFLALIVGRPELWVLSNRPGVAAEQLTSGFSPTARLHSTTSHDAAAKRIEDSLKRLRDLAEYQPVRGEALAHIAWLEFLIGRLADSSHDFHSIADEQLGDRFIQSLAWTGLGVLHDSDGDQPAALAAFQRAVDLYPDARAAASALAAHMLDFGNRAGAKAVLQAAYTRARILPDPWRHVIAPERDRDGLIASLRQQVGIPPSTADIQDRSQAVLPESNDHASDFTMLPQDPAAFRATTDAVTFDVSVTDRNVPVEQLGADDFVVTDNGQPCAVTVTPQQDRPIDVSLVFAFFVHGESRNVEKATERRGLSRQARQAVRDIQQLLTPADRLRVIQVDGDGRELWPLTSASVPVAVDRLPAERDEDGRLTLGTDSYGRLEMLYDSVFSAAARSDDRRRQVVIALGDAADGGSLLTPQEFVKAIDEADSTVYWLRRLDPREAAATIGLQGLDQGLLWPADAATVDQAARTSGGLALFDPNGAVAAHATEILGRFRQSYVVSYVLTNASKGTHVISVRLNKTGSFVIRAKSSYVVH